MSAFVIHLCNVIVVDDPSAEWRLSLSLIIPTRQQIHMQIANDGIFIQMTQMRSRL